MKTQEKIRKRLRELREEGFDLKNEYEYDNGIGDCEDADNECRAWLVAVKSMLNLLFGSTAHPYRSEIESICDQSRNSEPITCVGQVTAILERLISDLDKDLVFSIENRTRAAVFEDFLDESRRYVEAKKHREAGVLAASVFEDALRSLARNHNILDEGVGTDELISRMTNGGILTAVKAKRARTSAGVRNKAMHAQWNDIDLDDVKTLIFFTEALVSRIDEN